jgi:hypothetical protein
MTLIEMRSGKDLKYSNEVPTWARYAHHVLLAFLALFSIAVLGFGIYLLAIDVEWGLAIVLFFIAGFSGLVTWKLYRYYQFSHSILIQTELREDGYYTLIRNLKTSEAEETLIVFSQMDEVLIGRITRILSGPRKMMPFYEVVGARIIMVWSDERGKRHFSMFGTEVQENLDRWIECFQKNGVPVYTTHQNISLIEQSNLHEAYVQIPKVFYDSKSPYFHTGFKAHDPLPEWKSVGMRQKIADNQVHNDSKIFKPIFFGTLILNFLIAFLWMPHWAIEDFNFLQDTPSAMLGLLNILLIFFAKNYWRKKLAWYRPLLDIAQLIAVQLCGMAASLLYQSTSVAYFEAVIIDGIPLGFVLLFSFIGCRFVGR